MRGGAEFGEALGVDVEGTLEGEDADFWSIDHPLRVAACFGARRYPCQASVGIRIVSRGRKPRMLTLFAVAAFVISVLFAMGEVAYKRSFPKVTGVFVALFLVLLVGSAFMH